MEEKEAKQVEVEVAGKEVVEEEVEVEEEKEELTIEV